jgi:protein-disulfide isomerase
MLSKLFRIGFVTAFAAVIACGEAQPPPPQQPGIGPTAQSPGTQQGATVDGKDADKGMAARGAGGVPAGEAAEGDDLFGGGRDGAAEMAPAPRPARVGPWDGGDEVDTGEGSKSPIPVTAADPSWGSPKALVTIVEFSDLECPFCARAQGTLSELRRIYGKDQLRIVWKNAPLPFHKNARPAAEAAMSVHKLGGNKAFWAYADALFAGRLNQNVIDGSLPSGMSRKDVDGVLARGEVARKIAEDEALGKQVGVTGTPAFFINGVHLSGAQPIDRFRAVIDEQINAARKLTASGTAPAQVYATLSAKNYQKPDARPDNRGQRPAEDDKTVWRVPVEASPVRGKNTALVTVVFFTDFQCPFCARAAPTLDQLAKQYGDKIRFVYKNNPLPFHPRAEPAAELALEARAQKGDAAFWAVHDKLFADNQNLDDQKLEAIAKDVGIDAKKAMAAIASKKHAALIDKDQELADDIQASGTPHFFINGRRLVGAQPIEKFTAIIDEEITKAEALVKKGTAAAKVYDTIQKDAKAAPPPEKVTIPAPTKDNPSRGPANAKVVMQIFSDFQCPFCKRSTDTVAEMEKEFQGKIRIVWRNLPLPFHKDAMPAAEAAMEAFTQKGGDGFWKMHDLLFNEQTKLDRATLDQHARTLGLDATKFAAALDGHTHKPAIEADTKIADAAKISGTPAFVINGYLISGAQPPGKFRKIIKLALREAK